MAKNVNPKNNYSAGLVSCLFWLNETRITVPYYLNKTPISELKKIALDENIYQLRAEDRIRRLTGMIYRRLDCISIPIIEYFIQTDVSQQRIINLIAIMKSDLLFSEFMYYVLKSSIQLKKSNIDTADIKLFFDNKIIQSDIVANFSECSIQKLKQTYMKMLIEAGIIDNQKNKNILIPYIDINLQNLLRQEGNSKYLSILTGIDYE